MHGDKRIHLRPCEANRNVQCLNGSAYTKQTFNIDEVTCEVCLDGEQGKKYWEHYFATDKERCWHCAECKNRPNCKK